MLCGYLFSLALTGLKQALIFSNLNYIFRRFFSDVFSLAKKLPGDMNKRMAIQVLKLYFPNALHIIIT